MTPPAQEVSDTSLRAARAGVAMSVAVLAMALGSGIQAVLYLSRFGTTERTDAFFGAFALYTVFGVFTQAIRITSVPLLVGPGRMRGRQFASTLGVIAIPVLVACLALAGPLARALAPGVSPAARTVTVVGVRILGAAMVLQLGAAGAATLLAVWDRFDMIAGGYIAGAGAGLVAYFVAVAPAGELALGWSMLAMAVVTFVWMAICVRRAWQPGREAPSTGRARPLSKAAVILGRTLVYFVLNGLFLVTLAYASHQDAGDATVFSYAYLFASYLVAGTGLAVGISRVPAMSEGAQRGWRDVLADTVPGGFRYAMLVAAPAMAGLVAAGASLIGDLFPEQLPARDVETLQTFGALLMAWVVAALFVNFILPALFALGRARLVNVLSIPMVVLHVLATIAGERLFGLEGIVGAMFLAPLVFGLTLLAVAGGSRRAKTLVATARDAIAFPALAAVAFGVADALTIPLPAGIGSALLIAAIGSVLYVLGLRLAAPRQLAVLLGTRRRTAST
jgi:peptidoglycan biosynthesis protein MviN/MurJ (putative lipid II flippase)